VFGHAGFGLQRDQDATDRNDGDVGQPIEPASFRRLVCCQVSRD